MAEVAYLFAVKPEKLILRMIRRFKEARESAPRPNANVDFPGTCGLPLYGWIASVCDEDHLHDLDLVLGSAPVLGDMCDRPRRSRL